MSKKLDGEGNAIVEFEALELEEGGEDAPPSKLNKMLATLKEKLEPADYALVLSDLGLEGEDISNAELLEKFTELLMELKGGKKEEEKPEDKEKPEGGNKKLCRNQPKARKKEDQAEPREGENLQRDHREHEAGETEDPGDQ